MTSISTETHYYIFQLSTQVQSQPLPPHTLKKLYQNKN